MLYQVSNIYLEICGYFFYYFIAFLSLNIHYILYKINFFFFAKLYKYYIMRKKKNKTRLWYFWIFN